MTSRTLSKASDLLTAAARVRPVLGLDTGTPTASLALVSEGKIAGRASHPATSHGASLPAAVESLLREGGLEFRDLGAVAVGLGPGSYTGLRIGLSYAKGLSMASGCALVGVPSFDAAALAVLELGSAGVGMLICPVVDARRGQVYAALYRVVADGLEKLTEDLAVTLEHLSSRIQASVVLVGDTTAKELAALLNQRGIGAVVLHICSLESRGAMVAAVGAARFARGESDRSAVLEPLYVRPAGVALEFARQASAAAGTEGIWSDARKNSFGSI